MLLTAVDALRLNMPKRKVLQEEASKKRLNKGVDQPHFILDNIPPKGRGERTGKTIQKGDFI